ncbi:HD domain-containing phosphohydrolase [Iodobacter fluviatilis]|uniref:Cyclic di-GMP phosphodiesterase response regulator RpfG n=1 Tax=Iodobacter fluviatilis TaxID=537 RepID=A0A377Q3Z8_9NEIS|nr:HD domain-containing phosphohydrolase [Iodobacter fluviatilis]TCU90495.1 HD domain-containing protein [Iodobacter fluviatilis]STQ89522.1 Cyclic di-GMP phosphodiesterase response regulator RpfG [Iodobacter fluviatilis]
MGKGPHSLARGHSWPIKLSIATVVVLCMLVLAVGVIGIGWSGARSTLLDTAARTARDAGQLITEKSRRMLEPAQATLRMLVADPIASATHLEDRLLRLGTLSDVLTANELMSSVFVGYSDGSFMLVRPLDREEIRKKFNAPPMSNFMVQSVQSQPNGQFKREFLFFNASRTLLERRNEPDYRFDPRTRPWYKASELTAAPQLSEPYIFFSSRQIGVTLSQASQNGKAIFGIDVVLDDLANSLEGLKISPNTQLALVNEKGRVLAYPDMQKVLIKGGDKFEFSTVDGLAVPSLSKLNALGLDKGKVAAFEVNGQEWLGASLPFDVWQSDGMRLLVAAPSDDLLGGLRGKLLHLIVVVAVLALLLMPLGWWAGAKIGKSMDKLTAQAQRMSRFDFSQSQLKNTMVQEVNDLSGVMHDMGQTIETFLQISQDMATEPKVEHMLNNVLDQMVMATRCLAGVVYLLNHTSHKMERAAAHGDLCGHEEKCFMYTDQQQAIPETHQVAEGVVEMQIELRGRSGMLEGLLILQYQDDDSHADRAFTGFVHKLSGMLAVSIETRQLIDAQKKLLDAVIRLMADAIDAKSPYTGGHCERVPELAGMLVDQMGREESGPYAGFKMSEDQRYEFHLGAWLHDCGKVISPEHIIDKATKLETIYNRIHEIRMRFEVMWRDAELDHWRAVAFGGDEEASFAMLKQHQQVLQDDFSFVARCNVGGEFMADEDIQRLQQIGRKTWLRYFDKQLGLSADENRRLGDYVPEKLPIAELLLADRSDHVVPWGERKPAVEKGDPNNHHGFDMELPKHAQNMGELYNLSIRRGTLTEEDRFKINDHIVQTLIMLRGLPWPARLAKVPDIAATHHEKLDGKGYPRRLSADQLSTADRVMALADVFEALTAADRPYKSPKTLTESLKIMASMAKDQHIDAELFRYFLHSKLWLVFAGKFMRKEQIDDVDIAAIEKLLPIKEEQVPPRSKPAELKN